MVSEKRKVTVSGIIPRNYKWNKNAEEINNHLKDMCKIALTDYTDNSSFNTKKHLSNSKLHLNEKGSYKLNSVFLNHITTLFKWFKWYESGSPIDKDNLFHNVLLNQSDNEATESDSTTFSSNNQNVESSYFGDELKPLRINHINGIIRDQIYINSIRSKFDYLLKGVRGNVDILMISEAKIEASFSATQFLINGYTSPYRLNRKGKGGGILSLCLREHTVKTNYSQSSKYRRFS